MCPSWRDSKHTNKAQGWALFRKAISAISADCFSPRVDCITCGKKFSLQQGVSEAFSSDIVIDDFRHNSHENGMAEVTVGRLTKIHFKKPFLDVPEVNLTPYLKPVNAVTGYTTQTGFAIFSCANACSIGEKCQIGWHASGNRASKAIPLWRQLLSSAKDQQKRRNFRSEIVELETAFEVFSDEYIARSLTARLRQETVDWLLKKQSIEEKLSVCFRELTGTTLPKLHSTEYNKWQQFVKNKRDSIVHKGSKITPEQARNARKATFDLLTRIDNSTMEHFQIQMDDIGTDGPHFTFGIGKGTGTQQTIQHCLKK